MGYDLDLISSQLEHFSAERLAALRVEWADDKVMSRLILEAQELYHGIMPSNRFRPDSAQLEALGFPLAYQFTPHRFGLYQVTDRAEGEATRMMRWWVGTDQY
jgi:hypothetical protein